MVGTKDPCLAGEQALPSVKTLKEEVHEHHAV